MSLTVSDFKLNPQSASTTVCAARWRSWATFVTGVWSLMPIVGNRPITRQNYEEKFAELPSGMKWILKLCDRRLHPQLSGSVNSCLRLQDETGNGSSSLPDAKKKESSQAWQIVILQMLSTTTSSSRSEGYLWELRSINGQRRRALPMQYWLPGQISSTLTG